VVVWIRLLGIVPAGDIKANLNVSKFESNVWSDPVVFQHFKVAKEMSLFCGTV